MSDRFEYVAKVLVERSGGIRRTAVLETGTHVEFGVHGPIKKLYNMAIIKHLAPILDWCHANPRLRQTDT